MSQAITFYELRREVLRYLDEAGDTGTTYDLAGQLLNQAHRRRVMMFPSAFLVWPYRATFATAVGRQEYALHEEFMRPLYFFNTTAKLYLKEVPERQLGPEGYRWNDATGPAEHFCLWGRYQVERQPTSASVITIVSDSALDTGGDYQLFIRGENASGRMESVVVNQNGTTSASTTVQFTKILQVSKSRQWNGTMTMTSNGGAVTNLVLGFCDMGKLYPYLYLLEGPTTAETIEYRFYRNPQNLVNDYDIPDIPYPFSELLVWDALVMFAGYNTEMNPQALSVFQAAQKNMEADFIEAFTEGQSLESRVRFVRGLDETTIGGSWGQVRIQS
jgi:hypothetical protein